jgi:hypothetical protein
MSYSVKVQRMVIVFVAIFCLLLLMPNGLSSHTTTIQGRFSQFSWLDWGVDQEQTEHCGYGIFLIPPYLYAQSFTPSKDKLTGVSLYLFKYGSPFDSVLLKVSIKANLTGDDLATKTINTSKVSIGTKAKWIVFDFSDISVTPETTYFLVCSGDKGNDVNAYCWYYDNEEWYARGESWIKINETMPWSQIPPGGLNPVDFCFKTYFRRPLGGVVQVNLLNLNYPFYLDSANNFLVPKFIEKKVM